jgi:hypothetical protein
MAPLLLTLATSPGTRYFNFFLKILFNVIRNVMCYVVPESTIKTSKIR